MTNYTPTDILNFIKELLKDDTNLVSVTMNPQNEPLQTEAGTTVLLVQNAIKIEFKDINKSDCFRCIDIKKRCNYIPTPQS